MKKMVCEICGSASIKKEKGVFVCKDCGTEYSLEDAKKLLVDDQLPDEKKKSESKSSKKDELVNYLYIYLNCYVNLNEIQFWLNRRIQFDEIAFLTENDFNQKNVKPFEPYNFSSFMDALVNLKDDTSYDKVASFLLGYDCGIEQLNKAMNLIVSFPDKICALTKLSVRTKNGWSGLREVVMPYSEYILKNGSESFDMHDIYSHSSGNIDFTKKFLDFCKKGKVSLYHYEYTWSIVSGEKDGRYIEKVNNFDKEVEMNLRFEDIYTNLYNLWLDEHSKQLKLMYQYIDIIKKVEKNFFVPYEYRKPKVLNYLIKLINDGRADDWKELVNLYLTDQYRENVLNSFGDLNTSLKEIEHTIEAGFNNIQSELIQIKTNLTDIYMQVTKANITMNNIRKLARKSLIVNFLDYVEG